MLLAAFSFYKIREFTNGKIVSYATAGDWRLSCRCFKMPQKGGSCFLLGQGRVELEEIQLAMGESIIEFIDPIGAYLLNKYVVGLDIIKLGGSPQAKEEQCHIAPQEQAFFFKARDSLKGRFCFFYRGK